MRGVTYYQRTLLLPIILLLWYIPVGDRPNPFTQWGTWGTFALFFALPYLVALVWKNYENFRKGTTKDLQEFTLLFPLRLALFQAGVCVIAGTSAGGVGGFFLGIGCGILLGLFTIVVVYIYVLAVHLVFNLLRWVRWIQEPANDVV